MKRARELDEAVDEIIETANARNEKGVLVQEVMQDPTIVSFFYARYALVDLLVKKPIRFINLISTNKAMQSFFGEFSGIWIALLDAFVEAEASTYYSEIYPFFIVQNHRARDGDNGPTDLPLIMKEAHPSRSKVPVPQLYISLGKLRADVPYYLVHYNELTRRYVDILQRVRDLRKWFRMPLEFFRYLTNYVGVEEPRLIAYHDYFLVDEAEPAFTYDTTLLYTNFVHIAAVIASYKVAPGQEQHRTKEVMSMHALEGKEYLPASALELLLRLQRKVIKLQKWIKRAKEEAILIEPMKIIMLDSATAQPYRDMVFNKTQGLYNTPEEQRKLFKAVFEFSLPNPYEYEGARRAEFIDKYGAPLQCAFCKKDTFNVDLERSLALCSLECSEQLGALTLSLK